jgi:hypothetical protein
MGAVVEITTLSNDALRRPELAFVVRMPSVSVCSPAARPVTARLRASNAVGANLRSSDTPFTSTSYEMVQPLHGELRAKRSRT